MLIGVICDIVSSATKEGRDKAQLLVSFRILVPRSRALGARGTRVVLLTDAMESSPIVGCTRIDRLQLENHPLPSADCLRGGSARVAK